MKKVILICSAFCMVNGQNLYSQGNNWTINRNFNTISTSNFLGTTNNQAIRIKTNNVSRALFTTGNALSTITGDSGDGLRIVNPVNGTAGELDLFTSANSGQNETHIVWGASGQISGQNSRLEFYGRSNGFRFNTTTSSGIYLFSRSDVETARIGIIVYLYSSSSIKSKKALGCTFNAFEI